MKRDDLTDLLRELEADPASVQLHYGRLEQGIAKCMGGVYDLSLWAEDDDPKCRTKTLQT